MLFFKILWTTCRCRNGPPKLKSSYKRHSQSIIQRFLFVLIRFETRNCEFTKWFDQFCIGNQENENKINKNKKKKIGCYLPRITRYILFAKDFWKRRRNVCCVEFKLFCIYVVWLYFTFNRVEWAMADSKESNRSWFFI